MPTVRPCQMPHDALLGKYLREGAYADCWVAEVSRPVSHAEYVEAFYTSAVFKLERWLLARLLARPSTDMQARELASSEIDAFAAWRVEARSANQLLLCDIQGRTRSWLMVAGTEGGSAAGTRLYFGSAVVALIDAKTGQATMGFAFRALLGFHKLYSRVLLGAACLRLARTRPA